MNWNALKKRRNSDILQINITIFIGIYIVILYNNYNTIKEG